MASLREACEKGSLEDVKQIIEHVNREKWHAGLALHLAATHGHWEIVKYLIELGAGVDGRNLWEETPLHVAVKHGHFEIVKYLEKHGADINYDIPSEGTALHVAASRGFLEIVKCLVERGADLNYRNQWGETALYVAAKHGHFQIVKYLVEHDADVNNGHWLMGTAVHISVKHGFLEIVKYLALHGADVNYEHERQGTALFVAAKHGSLEIVKYLVERSADVNCKSWINEPPVHAAVSSERSPLSIACAKGHTEIVRTLLKYNNDVRKEEKLECKNDEIIDILELELKKSVKHRDKLQILRSMDDEKLTKVKPPLKHFATNQSLSLGASSATSVYVGIMEDESEVAVKRMFTQSCSDAAENERKILEFINTKKSPFIVNYRHFFRDDIFMYLMLDLCEETLKELVHSQRIEYLRQHGPRMINEILSGLEFLHELGILHRDLKPSNVLVDLDGRMRLADFGISRVLNEDATTDYTDPKGTTGWMAAEVIEAIKRKVAGRYKKKSDVQVVGMIAFFILTKGKHPFGDRLDRMGNIVKGKPVNLKKLDYRKKLDDRSARKFVSWLISHKLEDRPYVHEALRHPFLDGIIEIVQRPEIIRI